MTYAIDEVRVAHYRNIIRSGGRLKNIVLRRLPNGKHKPIDGVQRMEAVVREGFDGVEATVIECTDDEAEQLRRELNPYNCQLN